MSRQEPRPQLRRASIADIDAVIAHVQSGFDSYESFLAPGWRAPPVAQRRELFAELLADTQTWALLALISGSPVGHVSFFPARERDVEPRPWRERPRIAGLAHLWQLFVLPSWWGRGVAAALHEGAVGEMAAHGYLRRR